MEKVTTKFLHFGINTRTKLTINNVGSPADLDYIASPFAEFNYYYEQNRLPRDYPERRLLFSRLCSYRSKPDVHSTAKGDFIAKADFMRATPVLHLPVTASALHRIRSPD